MKLPMKTLALLLSHMLLLSSCYTYRSLTRKEPITRDFLSKLEPGKKYEFELKTGMTQIIYLTSIEAETIAGYQYQKGGKKVSYSETFENVEKFVAKISVLKHNPYVTTAAIVVGTLSTFVLIFPLVRDL